MNVIGRLRFLGTHITYTIYDHTLTINVDTVTAGIAAAAVCK